MKIQFSIQFSHCPGGAQLLLLSTVVCCWGPSTAEEISVHAAQTHTGSGPTHAARSSLPVAVTPCVGRLPMGMCWAECPCPQAVLWKAGKTTFLCRDFCPHSSIPEMPDPATGSGTSTLRGIWGFLSILGPPSPSFTPPESSSAGCFWGIQRDRQISQTPLQPGASTDLSSLSLMLW